MGKSILSNKPQLKFLWLNKQSTSDKTKGQILEIICYLFVFLFLYTAMSKLIDFEKFQLQLGQSPIFATFPKLVAFTVPLTEILISIMLLFSKLRELALYFSLTLMVMFTTYIIVITRFTEFVPCSCGGILEKMNWTSHLYFNLAFVLFAVIGILLQNNIKKQN